MNLILNLRAGMVMRHIDYINIIHMFALIYPSKLNIWQGLHLKEIS